MLVLRILPLALALSLALSAAASAREGYIVVYRDSIGDPGARTDRKQKTHGFKASLRYRHALKGFAARLTPSQRAKLADDPDVAFVARDGTVRATASVPLAAGDTAPPGIRRIEAATATTVREASSANVAVIDTGIDLTHPDLNAVTGKNCVGAGVPNDDNGHGSHVAGTIGARNNGSGVVGVAPNTRLYAVKVLNSTGNGSWAQVICGIDWVTATRTDADPGNDVRVANMSLTGTGDPVKACATTTDAMHKAICNSIAAGVTYAVAAGNSSWDFDYAPAPDVPAAFPEVLTVTAISDTDGIPGGAGPVPTCRSGEADDTPGAYSNFALTAAGLAHTIAAPGTCVNSTWKTGGYNNTISGTSMATPHVVGAIALCLGETSVPGPCAGMTPAQIIAKVRSEAAARLVRAPAFDYAGNHSRYGNLVWTTAPPSGDTVPPTVKSTSPASAATTISPSTQVKVTFSEPMDTAATQAAFSLVRASNGVAVAGATSWTGNKLIFTPSAPLVEGVTYTLTVTTAARDVAGNHLATARTASFTTWVIVTAAPTATAIETGSPAGGNTSALAADDNVRFSVASAGGAAAWTATVPGVTNGLKTLKVKFRGLSSGACSQTLSLWNWATSAWVVLDTRAATTSESGFQKSAPAPVADYVSGAAGNGDVLVRVACSGGGAFTTAADLVQLTITQPA